MRVSIYAVGRMKAGPERELVDRYFDRFSKSGSALGFEFTGVNEIPESRAQSSDLRKREEAGRLYDALNAGAALILLDERGKSLTSETFADRLGQIRDQGKKQLIVAIGGPDGHDPELRKRADLVLALGTLTWPHQIARILVAEQLYRAATIMSGHPYHRS